MSHQICISYWNHKVCRKATTIRLFSISRTLCQTTGGHFACVCVHPLNDNSVGASNLIAGNQKLARKVTVLFKAILLVLWIPSFPTKNVVHGKNRTFSTRVFSCRFFSSGFSWPFQDLKYSRPKIGVPVSDLSFTGKTMHFNGLISKLMVLLIKEEIIAS